MIKLGKAYPIISKSSSSPYKRLIVIPFAHIPGTMYPHPQQLYTSYIYQLDDNKFYRSPIAMMTTNYIPLKKVKLAEKKSMIKEIFRNEDIFKNWH